MKILKWFLNLGVRTPEEVQEYLNSIYHFKSEWVQDEKGNWWLK